MINDPSFLILDEPTSGLDPLGCKEVKDLIMTLKKRGKTVVITSHLLSDIEDICDRVIILYGGRVRATGTLNELLTVRDEQRILTPTLPPAAMQKVLEILRENLHGETFSVDHPRRTLEEYFLDVISQAKAESIETAGVVGGGRIADYLSEQDKSAVVLNSLLAENAPAAAPEAPVAAAVPAVEEKLTELTEEPKVEAPAEQVKEPTEEQKEALDAANAKLNDLLGSRK